MIAGTNCPYNFHLLLMKVKSEWFLNNTLKGKQYFFHSEMLIFPKIAATQVLRPMQATVLWSTFAFHELLRIGCLPPFDIKMSSTSSQQMLSLFNRPFYKVLTESETFFFFTSNSSKGCFKKCCSLNGITARNNVKK